MSDDLVARARELHARGADKTADVDTRTTAVASLFALVPELADEVERLRAGRRIDSPEGLAALPQLSVVQFRGPASEPLVWQLDQEWFSAGLHFPMASAEFPADAFPAYVLWTPEAD